MDKSYPSTWTTRQIAYFAGILSSLIVNREGMDAINVILEECASAHPSEVYFSDMVAKIEPRISADDWRGCVESCNQIFGRVL